MRGPVRALIPPPPPPSLTHSTLGCCRRCRCSFLLRPAVLARPSRSRSFSSASSHLTHNPPNPISPLPPPRPPPSPLILHALVSSPRLPASTHQRSAPMRARSRIRRVRRREFGDLLPSRLRRVSSSPELAQDAF